MVPSPTGNVKGVVPVFAIGPFTWDVADPPDTDEPAFIVRKFVKVVATTPFVNVAIPETFTGADNEIPPFVLVNVMLLNVVGKMPPMVCKEFPLNATVPVPAVNVQLFVQSLPTVILRLLAFSMLLILTLFATVMLLVTI